MTDGIPINGEVISRHEAAQVIRTFIHDCQEVCGEFHTMRRSKKFRANWGNDQVYAAINWRHFVDATRRLYSQRLGDPFTPPHEARQMHLAIVLWDMIGQGQEGNPAIQIARDTEAFEGDKIVNRETVEQFGPQSNTIAEAVLGPPTRHPVN